MPYIMVMGSLSAPHLSKDEGATVYGLKSEERATLVRVNFFVLYFKNAHYGLVGKITIAQYQVLHYIKH